MRLLTLMGEIHSDLFGDPILILNCATTSRLADKLGKMCRAIKIWKILFRVRCGIRFQRVYRFRECRVPFLATCEGRRLIVDVFMTPCISAYCHTRLRYAGKKKKERKNNLRVRNFLPAAQKPQTARNLSKLHIENTAGQLHCSHANNDACGRKSILTTASQAGTTIVTCT